MPVDIKSGFHHVAAVQRGDFGSHGRHNRQPGAGDGVESFESEPNPENDDLVS
jgi:hypothetical protein